MFQKFTALFPVIVSAMKRSKKLFTGSLRLSLMMTVPMFLTCCSQDEEVHDDMPLSRLYELGLKKFQEEDYKKSEEYFKALEKQYPYSDFTLQAQLMMGFANYMDGHYTDAVENFKLFIQLHPYHKDVDYALYMIGMCYYVRVSYIERDQSMAKDAYDYFNEIIERFPQSKYAKDCQLKVQQMVDHISAEELHIARYYQKQFLYHAALNRLERVNKNSIHHAESFYRCMECYKGLSQNDEADKMKAKLLKEYPESLFAKKCG